MVALADIERARMSISNLIKKTPLVRSRFLSDHCGGEVYLKLENLQVTNSFKIRGALNRMVALSPEEKRRGVVAASSGNHAQAVAVCAEKLNLAATVVVPENAPRVKIQKIRDHNVELILHGEIYDQTEQYARRLAREKGLTFISAYNDPVVVAGQGTVGLEILEELPQVNSIIVPVSGGSILGGIAVAVKNLRRDTEIIGAQPETVAAMYHSLKAGKIIDIEMKDTVADGLSGNIEKGSITFELIQRYVYEIMLYDEQTIKRMIRLLWEKERQVVEGSGAISIAPIMASAKRFAQKQTVAVITGGNIDDEVFQRILTEGA